MSYLAIILISLLFPYLIILTEFPFMGAALLFSILASFVFYYKKHKDTTSKIMYFLILIQSFFLMLRADGFLFFINSLSIIYIGSYLIISKEYRNQLNFLRIVFLPLMLVVNFLRTKHDFRFDNKLIRRKLINHESLPEHFVSIVIAFLILLIIIPLLSYSNPIFNKWVMNVIELLNLNRIFIKLFGDSFIIFFARTTFFLFFVFLIPRLLAYTNKDEEQYLPENKNLWTLPLFLPKIITIIVLGIFFISQAQLYFANQATLQALGIMHSQYAREVFGQLSVVTLIIFFLVYNDKKRERSSIYTTYILLIEGIFLTSIALKSVYDYSYQWGFTHKRLYGFAGVIWLYGIFFLFSYFYIKKIKFASFIRNSILLSVGVLIGINILNFDYVIFHYSKSRTGQGIDYSYLSFLSSDSLSYKKQLESLQKQINLDTKNMKIDYDKTSAAYNLLWKVELLQKKYKYIDLRSFNINEYKQYRQIKNLDVKKYRTFINKIETTIPFIPRVPQVKPIPY